MGFIEILTIIFVVCKIAGFIDWSWLIVFLPEIIAIAFYIIVFGIFGAAARKQRKAIKKSFDDDFFKHF